MSDSDDDRQQIIDAIKGESDAYYLRDFTRWAHHWLHDDSVRRLATLAGGHISYIQGWNDGSALTARIMREHPDPNLAMPAQVRRENMVVRVSGDMAWASFDQYTPRTTDVLVNVGLSHQIRVFERHDGQWKIVFAGHGDTRTEYFAFPAIRVGPDMMIEWMNDAARTRLPDHPVLTKSAGKLRARSREADKQLREVLAGVANLSPMDVRASLHNEHGNQSSVPLVVEDALSEALHIIWVSQIDGQTLVAFDDQETKEHRLAAAQSIYGLSDAQARLAQHIIDGRDLGQAAACLGISVNTARTHLQRMFEKTRVHSQTALVRTLLSAAPPTA